MVLFVNQRKLLADLIQRYREFGQFSASMIYPGTK